ncbi:MAG: hypothetical protein H5U40_14130, partial [Polyangiaceae bacterium]|nr:hypothetical protein [Polyangiaceae bacterium]
MLRVLLCAERQSDFAITAGFLKARGRYAVDWAHSYADAIARASSGEHHVLLADAEIGMGRGLELLEHQIDTGSTRPIILLIGERDAALELAALRAGAADVLVRDAIDPSSLERAVRHAAFRARVGQPFGWRPGASTIVSTENGVDRVEIAIHRARRTRLGCAVLAVSYDMPSSARRDAERMGASFYATLSERLRHCVGPDDDVFRLAPHELLVVASGLHGPRAAAEHGGKILSALS